DRKVWQGTQREFSGSMHDFDDKATAPLWKYKGVLVEADPGVLMMRSSSTRLALLDRVTGVLRVAWRPPGRCSVRPEGRGFDATGRPPRFKGQSACPGLIEASCSGRSSSM